MKEKILVLTSTFPRWEKDTTPRFVFDLEDRLANYFDLTVLAPHYPKSKKSEIIKKIKVKRFTYFYPKKYQKLCYDGGIISNYKKNLLSKIQVPFLILSEFMATRKIIKTEKIRFIHAHWAFPQGLVSLLIKKIYKIPYLLTIHGSDLFALNNFFFIFLQKKIVTNSVFCTVNSLATRNEIIKRCPSSKNKIKLIPMGVNLASFRKLYGKKKLESPIFLSVGRLTEQKGIQYMLKALPKILTPYPNTKYIVVGEGSYKSNLELLCKKLNLQKNVKFIGSLSQEGLIKYYNSADIFILPSISIQSGKEALGLAILEAISCRTPVIASNSGGIKDVIKDKKTGILVKQKDPADLSKKIIFLLENKKLKQSIIKNSYTFIRDRYSWNNVENKFKNLYKGTIKSCS